MSRSVQLQRKGSLPGYHKDPAGGGYLAGDLIDNKYRLARTLGEGGMGVVWVARNVVLDVDVALKLIPLRRGAEQPILTKRLLQEARAAAQLNNPAICRVFDYGQTHLGDPFVVSELMHGETFADVLDTQNRLPATRAAQILLPVLDGLAVAHTQGIVHRDVKPENIFLSRDVAGRLQPKLLDFGIARFVDTESKITVDGALLGTPSYMSPEQARGEGGADFRTDVWSICVVLYEAVTGDVPFDADNYNAILNSVINSPAQSILDYGAGDANLWAILERGLHKDPAERWQSMRELGEALALWLYDHGIREDVCGASLRTTWLAANASGTHFDLGPESVAPVSGEMVRSDNGSTPALAPVVPLEASSDEPLEIVHGEGPDRHPRSHATTLSGGVTQEQGRHASRGKQIAIAAGGAVLVGLVGLVVGLTAGGRAQEDTAAAPVNSEKAAAAAGSIVRAASARPSAAAASASASATAPTTVDAEDLAVEQAQPVSEDHDLVRHESSSVPTYRGSSSRKKKRRRDFGF